MTTNRILLVAVGLLAVTCLASARDGWPKPGGMTCEEPAEDRQQEILEKVHPQIEKKTGESFESLEAISYRWSGSTRTNYIKVKAIEKDGSKSYKHIIHIKVFSPAPNVLKLAESHTVANEEEPLWGNVPC